MKRNAKRKDDDNTLILILLLGAGAWLILRNRNKGHIDVGPLSEPVYNVPEDYTPTPDSYQAIAPLWDQSDYSQVSANQAELQSSIFDPAVDFVGYQEIRGEIAGPRRYRRTSGLSATL